MITRCVINIKGPRRAVAAAGQRTAADITASTGNSAVHARRLDLADQDSIAAFAEAWSGPLHLLIDNA
jgi:hypothetical protein